MRVSRGRSNADLNTTSWHIFPLAHTVTLFFPGTVKYGWMESGQSVVVVLDDLRFSSTAFNRFGHDCISASVCLLFLLFFFSYWFNKICRLFATGQRKKLVFTATDFMLFDSNNLVYFEILRPKNISYVFKVRPAKSFGGKFVSGLFSQIQI